MLRIRTTLLLTAAVLLASPILLGTATAEEPAAQEQDAAVPGLCVYIAPGGDPPVEVYPCEVELPPV